MRKKIKVAIIIAAVAVLALGCAKKSEYSKYITLGKYKGVEVEATGTEVTDQDVQDQIQTNLENASTTQPITDRDTVANGDVANIDYQGLLDGKEFDGGTATGQDLTIGAGQFIEGFEQQLIGVKVGSNVSINVTFPADYQAANLAGKAVVFNVKVNGISKTVVPELNDAFVQANSDFKTVAEYKDSIRKELEATKADDAKSAKQSKVWAEIEKNTKVKSYPQNLVDKAKEQIQNSYSSYAAQAGVDMDTFMQTYFGMTLDDYGKKAALQEMIFKEIAAREGIKVTSKEVKEKAAEYAQQYGFETSDSFIAQYGEDVISDSLLWEKVNDFVLKHAKEKAVESSETSANK